ncbi:uncharacterized protein MONBRDRAFT_18781 [Monosiga brevicollis MX1]|uniref:40S ribosomal protein S19 n=1 Tax=Monosiga brevicollis TaxID=81824 RepID=A9UXP6_MONBE|nr:uncharacterized protein MONBRDRAFT_18781 [Monosiga brevicollis MX1]EDQ89725.1 predicted protein [Monosiga brevicollis MX1]|eukprot:XP_001745147.1 hypothetical protein [Monosiga brevicollis MX1]
MACVTVKDVPADQLIAAYAALLKRQGKIPVPSWVDLVKTSTAKELAPYNDDWFYVRCAALARHLYVRGGVGIGALRRVYGGSKPRGNRPSRFERASGSIIRKALQGLEAIKVVEKAEDGGRKLTRTGQRDLDRIAQDVAGAFEAEE